MNYNHYIVLSLDDELDICNDRVALQSVYSWVLIIYWLGSILVVISCEVSPFIVWYRTHVDMIVMYVVKSWPWSLKTLGNPLPVIVLSCMFISWVTDRSSWLDLFSGQFNWTLHYYTVIFKNGVLLLHNVLTADIIW